MILIGHDWIPYESFYFIKSIDDIKNTPSSAKVIFQFSKDTLDISYHCEKNNISFALICDTKKDVLLAQALNCDFIVCDKTIVKEAQKFADGYLFDAKILLYSASEDDILWAGEEEIDGILFEKGIDYGSC